jgi:capsular exopolysaccharide synthesis family protein
MADHLVPSGGAGLPQAGSNPNALTAYSDVAMQPWMEPRGAVPALAKSPLERPVAAVRRYKWLMLVIIALTSAAGVAATQMVSPQFEVSARIMIAGDSPGENRLGPIRTGGLLDSDDWGQLLRSYRIADAVVRKLTLYLAPNDADDLGYFLGFGLAESFRPGTYELVVNGTSKRWTLASLPATEASESGAPTDSVGRKAGFLWQLRPWVWTVPGEHKVQFTVSTPRETAVGLIKRLNTQRARGSNFLMLMMQDADGKLAASILNTWVNEYVSTAGTLKKRKLTDFANTLEDQLQTAKVSLDSAESRLQTFRVNTITLPTEGSAIAPGLSETRDPVMREYFNGKLAYEAVRQDISALEQLIRSVSHDSVPSDAFLEIRSVAAGTPATEMLRTSVKEFHIKESSLATQRAFKTDEHPDVKALVADMATLKRVRIPQYAGELLASLKRRQVDDSTRLAAAGQDLKAIPERTLEEERLRRIRDIAAGLYNNLQGRYAEAQLAEASASPDISVLDSAIAPLSPTANTAPRVILIAIGGGIAAALALAILLDFMDNRLRYPEQATDDLGLSIAGAIPKFPPGGIQQNSPDQAFQLIESFRSLRMSVLNASTNGRVSVAISSPSPSEGKSLIAANLAMSFADAGYRTILVDGDTRRGALHELFGIPMAPGLTDYLTGRGLGLVDVIRPTTHESLHVISGGTRRRRSPELLTSPVLPQLLADLRATYDVVIVDTPPLAAGVDGYSIASAAGSLLVVLRVGQTARRMAAEKLRMFDRLPVNIVGAVLNGVQFTDGYGYYGYTPGYDAVDEESTETSVAQV